MRLLDTSIMRAWLGALFVLPLCVRSAPSQADDARSRLEFRDMNFTISQKTLLEFDHNGRTILITTNVITREDGTVVEDADDADALQAFTAIFTMLNSTLGFPVAPADELSASEAADTLVTNATANDDKTLEIRVGKDFAGTFFAETKAKIRPGDRAVILLNLKKINTLLECLVELTEVRDAGGNVSTPDPGVLRVVRTMFLIHTIARLLVQADSNLEVANVNGQEVVRPRPGLMPVVINHGDPEPRSSSSPIDPQAADLTPPLSAANTVVQQMLDGNGQALSQRVSAYLQANPADGTPESEGGEVFDLEITSRDGLEQVVTVLAHEVTSKKTIAERVVDMQIEEELERRRQDESSQGCATAAAVDAGFIRQITELPSPTPTVEPLPEPGGPVTTPGTDTGGTSGDTEGEEDTLSIDTDGEATDGEATDDTGDSGGSDSGGPISFACDPDNAPMSGPVVPQAGIDIDVMAPDCTTVTGFPPGDQLVIDDFGGGNFGGSGSGLTVVEVSAGRFFNDPSGFYFLDGLPAGVPIEVAFEDAEGTAFTITFTIVQGVDGMPSQLVDTSMTLRA
ncbi:MAG: hypothetical protein K0V04_21610 [Deltaproteobacteria bacterium]|nr:hypothetical protein [Deltaproteobacteria bacterium]